MKRKGVVTATTTIVTQQTTTKHAGGDLLDVVTLDAMTLMTEAPPSSRVQQFHNDATNAVTFTSW